MPPGGTPNKGTPGFLSSHSLRGKIWSHHFLPCLWVFLTCLGHRSPGPWLCKGSAGHSLLPWAWAPAPPELNLQLHSSCTPKNTHQMYPPTHPYNTDNHEDSNVPRGVSQGQRQEFLRHLHNSVCSKMWPLAFRPFSIITEHGWEAVGSQIVAESEFGVALGGNWL